MQRFSAYLKPPSLGDAYVLDGTLVSDITRRLRTAADDYNDELQSTNPYVHHIGIQNDATPQVQVYRYKSPVMSIPIQIQIINNAQFVNLHCFMLFALLIF